MADVLRCLLCSHKFTTERQYERHVSRKTSCISQKAIIDMLNHNNQQNNLKNAKIVQLEARERRLMWDIEKHISLAKDVQSKYDKEKTELATHITRLERCNKDIKEQNTKLRLENSKITSELEEQIERNDAIEALLDQKKVQWNEIVIVSSTMGSHAKNVIKRAIQYIKDKNQIEQAISERYKHVAIECIHTDTKKSKLTIHLSKRCSECQICFTNTVVDKQRCKQCKEVQICKDCEKIQVAKFHRCAFCNVPYQ